MDIEEDDGPEAGVAEPATENQEPERDFDKEARDMGWVPETEFRGPKDKWKPAKDFVEDGEKILPIVRSQLKREREERERDKTEFQKRVDRLEKGYNTAFEAAKRQHEAELTRIKSDMRAAVAAGDEVGFDRLEKQREKLEKDAPKAETVEPPADPVAAFESERTAWVEANPWFNADFEVNDWAIRFSDFNGRKNPTMTFAENMAIVTREAQKRFPQAFGGAKKGNGSSAVDPGSDFSGVFKRGKSGADLPAEARAAAEKFVKQGLFKDVNAYAKEYFSEQ